MSHCQAAIGADLHLWSVTDPDKPPQELLLPPPLAKCVVKHRCLPHIILLLWVFSPPQGKTLPESELKAKLPIWDWSTSFLLYFSSWRNIFRSGQKIPVAAIQSFKLQSAFQDHAVQVAMLSAVPVTKEKVLFPCWLLDQVQAALKHFLRPKGVNSLLPF